MGLSLPGNRLIYLLRDDLAPESFERILDPQAAWRHAEQNYAYDDRWNQRYIVNIDLKSVHPFAGTLPRQGEQAKSQLRTMIERGDVVCLNEISVLPAELFYINNNGALICRDESVFRFDGAKKIVAAFNLAVKKRDYSHSGGKPSSTSSRLLKTGRSYPVFSERNDDALISEIASISRGNRKVPVADAVPESPGMVNNIAQTSASTESVENEAVVTAQLEVNGRTFTDTNQTARPAERTDADKPTLVQDRVLAKEQKLRAKGKTGNLPLPNSNMANAHAEIGVIQQAHDAGVAKGEDLNITVTGRDVCDYCRSDIAPAAKAAGAKSVTVYAVDETTQLPKKYYWDESMKKLTEVK